MIMAVDPGREKCGLAVLKKDGTVIYREIIQTEEFGLSLKDILKRYNIETVVLGNGTYSSELEEEIIRNSELPVVKVDEAYTTFEAEKRYRKENLKGLKKIFSIIFWKPARPVDDYVAVILGERYLKNHY